MEIVRKQSRQWTKLRQEFLEAQAGICAICGKPPQRPTLDHCHATGILRGTLCTACNVMLGWYEKNCASIQAYLSRVSEHQVHKPVKRRHPVPAREERLRRHAEAITPRACNKVQRQPRIPAMRPRGEMTPVEYWLWMYEDRERKANDLLSCHK